MLNNRLFNAVFFNRIINLKIDIYFLMILIIINNSIFKMLAEYFTRELRLKISLCSVIILAAIS